MLRPSYITLMIKRAALIKTPYHIIRDRCLRRYGYHLSKLVYYWYKVDHTFDSAWY